MNETRDKAELRALDAFEDLLDADDRERTQRIEQLEQSDPVAARLLRDLLAADGSTGLSRPVDSIRVAGSGPLCRGDRVGPWQIVKEIGRGGMGVVFEAHRVEGDFEQKVAIKVLHHRPDHSDSSLRRFEQERDVLGRLDHPGIARILDAGRTEGGATFLALELVDGDRIDRACDNRRLTLRERVELVVQVCAALSTAHRQLVVHRDLKPANVLVTRDGYVKLLDFGVAMLLAEDAPKLTRTVDGLGPLTPEYASPEQILGERISTLTDVYSLGVVLYELLVGRPPVERTTGSALQLERSVVSKEPPPPSRRAGAVDRDSDPPAHHNRRLSTPEQLQRQLRGDLDRIVLQAIQRAPERRYQSIDAFQRDLANWLAGRPVAARGNGVLYRAGKFARRNWLVLSFAVALAVSLVGGLFAARQQATESERQRLLAEQQARQTELVNSFLVDLFAAPADRWWRDLENGGRDVRVLDVLDEAASRIDVELAGAPAQQAELHQTLVDTFLVLKDPKRGEEHSRKALAIRRQLFGDASPQVAESLYYLANVIKAQRRPQEALAVYAEAIATEEVLREPTNNYHHALIEGAYLASFERRPELAQGWLAAAAVHLGPRSAALPYLLARRSIVALERGDTGSARQWLDQLESFDPDGLELEVPSPERHLKHVRRLHDWWTGRLDGAAAEAVLAAADDALPQVDQILAQALYDMGLYERARKALRHTVTFGPTEALQALLALELDQDLEACRALAREAESHVLGRSGNAPTWRTTEALIARAACEARAGEHLAALELLRRAESASEQLPDAASTPVPLRDRIRRIESAALAHAVP